MCFLAPYGSELLSSHIFEEKKAQNLLARICWMFWRPKVPWERSDKRIMNTGALNGPTQGDDLYSPNSTQNRAGTPHRIDWAETWCVGSCRRHLLGQPFSDRSYV